ncbi:hypothetical protein LSAT2_003541 [Lamellibrachia satsuma]|nr:hypothetical protein LSAT2_003541 [Lamellibrachia satsuma]
MCSKQGPRCEKASVTNRECMLILPPLHKNQISRVLPKPTKERVVNATITSQLDYCNALLYGMCVGNIANLQRIHNSAARLIQRRPRSDRARPLLQELHWLPVISKLDLNRRYSMVRTYKRNSTQGSYGSFRLAVAVATVREGQSIRGTGADYGIPVSELQEMGTRRVHCGRPILHLPQL